MSMDNIEIIISDPDIDEVIRAGQYLMMREMNMTMEEIAKKFGYTTRQSLYNLINKWNKNGALEKARDQFLTPKIEEIRQVNNEVLDAWPKIVRRMVSIATTGRDRTALEAAAWLKQQVVDPELESRGASDASELAYAKRSVQQPPNLIRTPKFLVKSVETPAVEQEQDH